MVNYRRKTKGSSLVYFDFNNLIQNSPGIFMVGFNNLLRHNHMQLSSGIHKMFQIRKRLTAILCQGEVQEREKAKHSE